jgi:hypothetical protein
MNRVFFKIPIKMQVLPKGIFWEIELAMQRKKQMQNSLSRNVWGTTKCFNVYLMTPYLHET